MLFFGFMELGSETMLLKEVHLEVHVRGNFLHDVLIIVLLKLIHCIYCVYSVVVLSLDQFLVLIAILFFCGKPVTGPISEC